MTTAVGIDVGKVALDLAVDGVSRVTRFANSAVGIRKLVARLGRLDEPRIVAQAFVTVLREFPCSRSGRQRNRE